MWCTASVYQYKTMVQNQVMHKVIQISRLIKNEQRTGKQIRFCIDILLIDSRIKSISVLLALYIKFKMICLENYSLNAFSL